MCRNQASPAARNSLKRVPGSRISHPGTKQVIKTRICVDCGRLLTKAANALRQHETDIQVGLRLNLAGDLTEELRQKLAPDAVKSFNAARAAWDTYCRHLDGHGLLEPALRGKTPD